MKTQKSSYRLVLAAFFLAVALALPFLTAQIPIIGKMLCPMHLPVLLCGFLCGPWYGLAVGVIAPLLRSFLFGAPALLPTAVIMSAELLTYGAVCGMLYRLFPPKKKYVYVSLLLAMIAGRIVWGVAHVLFLCLGQVPFGWAAFAAGAFTDAIPGIIIQVTVIPPLVVRLSKE